MACRNIIRVVFGIDTLEQHIEVQKTRLRFDVKSIDNYALRHSYFFLLRNLTKQIKSITLCLGRSKIDHAEPLKH